MSAFVKLVVEGSRRTDGWDTTSLSSYSLKSFLIILASWMLLVASPANANEVALFETDSAVAGFISIDSSCVTTSTNVYASNHIIRFDQTVTSAAFITVNRRDNCDGVDLIDAIGVPVFQANEFVVKKNLKLATLVANISMHDFVSGTNMTVSINFTWRNTGRLVRSWTLSSDGFLFIVAKEAIKTYLATASGEIRAAGENFTPSATQNAAISADDNMFVIRQ